MNIPVQIRIVRAHNFLNFPGILPKYISFEDCMTLMKPTAKHSCLLAGSRAGREPNTARLEANRWFNSRATTRLLSENRWEDKGVYAMDFSCVMQSLSDFDIA